MWNLPRQIIQRLSKRYRFIAASGLFQAGVYRDRYLKDLDVDDPLLHYLYEGESAGYRPNAFFDPLYFKRNASTSSFYEFLTDPSLWDIACSEQFDCQFYRAGLPATRRIKQPLIDFWEIGLNEERSTAEEFDTRFFIHAVCRHVEIYAKDVAFKTLTSSSIPPCNEKQLADLQTVFFDQIEMVVVQEIIDIQRPNLLFVQCSRSYNIRRPAERSYDVMLNFYDGFADRIADVEYVVSQNGTKTTAIRKILGSRPELLLKYAHVMFVDDDVAIESETIDQIFREMVSSGLDLAQPSLTADSATYFDILKQPAAGTGLTQLSAVEIMMPVVSRRALEQCGWTFSAGVSGWAVDFLLGAEIQKKLGTLPTLVGSCVAEHIKPYSLHGAYYRYLDSYGIDARIEAGAIDLKYGDGSPLWIRPLEAGGNGIAPRNIRS